MMVLIVCSMWSLFWVMILLALILYVFAVCFTQGVTDFLGDAEHQDSAVADQLREHYGSLLLSAYTLFASITNGVSWSIVCVHSLARAVCLRPSLLSTYFSASSPF